MTRKNGFKSKTNATSSDVVKETSDAQRITEIARDRNYYIDTLLSHELTSTSFFLTKDGTVLKTNNLNWFMN